MPTQSEPGLHHYDIDELLQTGEPVILAVDQAPFEVESRGVKNTFCLLVPLMTESGAEVQRDQFANRGRVWWMLRSDIDPAEIRVGMIWTAPIERSREFRNPDPEKDHYQARRQDIRRGARHFVEVLTLHVLDPDLDELLSPEGIEWRYPPLPRVIVRGAGSVVGPFRTYYDYGTGRVRFESLTPGNPQVFRMSRREFEARSEIREFSYTANQWDSKSTTCRIDIALVHERDLAILEQHGERLDGATDIEVVRWALELMDIPSADRERFEEILARAREIQIRAQATEFPERFDRFLKLAENRERIIRLGSKVAEAVAAKDVFRELVDRHIAEITAKRVDAEIEQRRQEIERTTAEAEARLERTKQKIAQLEAEYVRRTENWEREFEERNRERIQRLEEREQALAEQEKKMRERLQGLVDLFNKEADNFAERVLGELQVLRRLGIFDGTMGSGGAGSERLVLPGFLETQKERSGMREEEFLDRFEEIVGARGFVFDREDLVNFHVLLKCGQWTIITGASGVGKSSLPRLYAEALGCADEFLLIPVRPDWLDDRDVLGAFNALTGRYEPAATGLVERLIAAHEDLERGRGGIYIVCLDEMNLARVEHYFAQFLSVLEQPAQQRAIQLFARGAGDPADPYARYRTLPLGGNLRFVGTVNIDETSHFFTPKVIDRASVVSLGRPDLRRGLHLAARSPAAGSLEPVHLEDYLSWVRPPDTEGEPVELVLKVDEILSRSRLALGFRRRNRLLTYVSSARDLLGEDQALDLALLQIVVPALRPTAPRYGELLKELGELLPRGRFHRTAEALEALAENPECDYFQLL